MKQNSRISARGNPKHYIAKTIIFVPEVAIKLIEKKSDPELQHKFCQCKI